MEEKDKAINETDQASQTESEAFNDFEKERHEYENVYGSIKADGIMLGKKFQSIINEYLNSKSFNDDSVNKDELEHKKWNALLNVTFSLGLILKSLSGCFYDEDEKSQKDLALEIHNKSRELIKTLLQGDEEILPCGACPNCLDGDFEDCVNPIRYNIPTFDFAQLDEAFIFASELFNAAAFYGLYGEVEKFREEKEVLKNGNVTENSGK